MGETSGASGVSDASEAGEASDAGEASGASEASRASGAGEASNCHPTLAKSSLHSATVARVAACSCIKTTCPSITLSNVPRFAGEVEDSEKRL